MSSSSSIDYLANFTIACCAFVMMVVYSSMVLSPAWDDGTGLQLFKSHFDFEGPNSEQLQNIRENIISKSARLWAANLSVEVEQRQQQPQSSTATSKSSAFVADVFDSRAELGRHHVMRVSFCENKFSSTVNGRVGGGDDDPVSFCVCEPEISEQLRSETWNHIPCVPADVRKQHERKFNAPDDRQVAVMLRFLAQRRVETIESEALDRLIIRLRHYFQTGAGIDALFRSVVEHLQYQVEEAPIAARRAHTLVQPRLPPKRDKKMKLNFIVAEKDSRWIHDLSKDPSANAMTHAPFVFPMFLILLSCVVRIAKGIGKSVISAVKFRRKGNKNQQEGHDDTTKTTTN